MAPSVQRNLLITASLILAALLIGIGVWQPSTPKPKADGEPLGGDFRLQSADGPVALSDFRGKLVLLYFGYTRCPDICPTTLGYLAIALEGLSEKERQQLQVIFVSVDPERDDLAHLQTYARFFHPSFLGISGQPDAVKAIATRYGAAYHRVEGDSSMGYSVDHTADLYMIDQAGKLQGRITHGTAPEDMVRRFRPYLIQP
jgi:protein SCO1/2